MCRIIKRFIKGIEVNEKTIAFNTIANVGIRGTYLMEDNTIENLRSGEHVELFASNGANYEMWRRKGAKSSTQQARDIVNDIIAKGNKSPLDSETDRELPEIIDKYEKQMGLKG